MIVTLYYAILFGLSVVLSVLYVFQWHKHFDTHIAIAYLVIPITTLAYYLLYQSHDTEAAILATKFLYLGGCLLPWLILMSIASLCKYRVGRFIRIASFILNVVMFSCVLTVGHSPLFYRSLRILDFSYGMALQKEYGPLHTVYYGILILYLAADVGVIVHTYRKEEQVSRKILNMLFAPIIISMAAYLLNRYTASYGFELVPLSYLFAQLIYLSIAYRMALYDVSDTAVESMVQSGDTGFITVDLREHYLDSNETAKEILPALNNLTVDRSIREEPALQDTVVAWLDHFRNGTHDGKELYIRDSVPNAQASDGADRVPEEQYYTVSVNDLYDGTRKRGYQIFLEDDTQNQRYIRLLDGYNTRLQTEVTEKTERIVQMHDNLIMGMASMVESRDNSTGGHIRRTSEGVRILVEEMRKEKSPALTDEFCKKLIKAAPMHDLGKIAVDDAVLRKPGRFTQEEFEKMKAHATEGARIVHSILKDTDDEAFKRIAENVAHYHHERVDGSGYPEGLKGEEIPLEARIMAIADVYDALVSRRVYKEKMSFSAADEIILEGMGSQFDPALRKYYEAARPALEAYYETKDSHYAG